MARVYNDSALALYKQMVIDYPDNCYAHASCGLAYASLGNVTDAIIEGKTAVELTGDDELEMSDMILNLAKIYIMTNDYANANRQVDFLLNNPSAFSLNLLKVDPTLKRLEKTPEFKAMTSKKP
jgi:tetratricopeptide (TPR) repeat protein